MREAVLERDCGDVRTGLARVAQDQMHLLESFFWRTKFFGVVFGRSQQQVERAQAQPGVARRRSEG